MRCRSRASDDPLERLSARRPDQEPTHRLVREGVGRVREARRPRPRCARGRSRSAPLAAAVATNSSVLADGRSSHWTSSTAMTKGRSRPALAARRARRARPPAASGGGPSDSDGRRRCPAPGAAANGRSAARRIGHLLEQVAERGEGELGLRLARPAGENAVRAVERLRGRFSPKGRLADPGVALEQEGHRAERHCVEKSRELLKLYLSSEKCLSLNQNAASPGATSSHRRGMADSAPDSLGLVARRSSEPGAQPRAGAASDESDARFDAQFRR